MRMFSMNLCAAGGSHIAFSDGLRTWIAYLLDKVHEGEVLWLTCFMLKHKILTKTLISFSTIRNFVRETDGSGIPAEK